MEVIVSVGVLTGAVMAMLLLQGHNSREVAEISGQERAAHLVDACLIELARVRDRTVPEGQRARLDAFAEIVPASDSAQAFRLFVARDGLRAVNESDAEDPVIGLAARDRYFLVEVRQQRPPLGFTRGAGFLAVRLTVRWPYFLPAGPALADVVAADPEKASVVSFNAALTP